MKHLKNNFVSILILISAISLLWISGKSTSNLNAQQRVFTQTDISVIRGRFKFKPNSQDTIYFSFNDSRSPTDTTFRQSFPEYGTGNGNIRFYAMLVSGGNADSLAILIKPCLANGELFRSEPANSLDSTFLYGSTSLTNYKNVSNSGKPYSYSISGVLNPTSAFAAIVKQGDVYLPSDSTTKVWEFGVIKSSNVSPANVY